MACFFLCVRQQIPETFDQQPGLTTLASLDIPANVLNPLTLEALVSAAPYDAPILVSAAS